MAKEVAITAIIDKDSRDKLCPELSGIEDERPTLSPSNSNFLGRPFLFFTAPSNPIGPEDSSPEPTTTTGPALSAPRPGPLSPSTSSFLGRPSNPIGSEDPSPEPTTTTGPALSAPKPGPLSPSTSSFLGRPSNPIGPEDPSSEPTTATGPALSAPKPGPPATIPSGTTASVMSSMDQENQENS
ncbi:proline-rich receptor-like protein kinase PERK1 [Alnus glutinosa]|uniref:proline-rich receptor-like protein kinase PERK1 n=1 Tax=Alnus glutinosa TaxID=3517 RepID=UPI002D7A2FD9|nr:proline-rich receptor-like protein kinase PERK1 [Alnus glutinosa]